MEDLNRWMGVEVRHLVALRTIARTRSFARAADALGYSPSAISSQIAALERIAGTQLVVRPGGTKPVSLTPAGERLAERARTIESEVTAARADIDAALAPPVQRLRVGSFPSVGAAILAPVLARLAELTVSLVEAPYDVDLLALVETGDLDITFAALPLEDGPFEALSILSDPNVLLVSRASPLAALEVLDDPRRLAGQRLIGTRRVCRGDQVEDQLIAQGVELEVPVRSDDNRTVERLVAAGVGIAIVPGLAVTGDSAGDVRAVPLGPFMPPRRIALAWHRDRVPETPMARLFVDAAVAQASLIGEQAGLVM